MGPDQRPVYLFYECDSFILVSELDLCNTEVIHFRCALILGHSKSNVQEIRVRAMLWS